MLCSVYHSLCRTQWILAPLCCKSMKLLFYPLEKINNFKYQLFICHILLLHFNKKNFYYYLTRCCVFAFLLWHTRDFSFFTNDCLIRMRKILELQNQGWKFLELADLLITNSNQRTNIYDKLMLMSIIERREIKEGAKWQ